MQFQDHSATDNGTSSALTYTLFTRDGLWDPNFVAEKTLNKVFDRYKPDGKGPNLETPGGMPYDYKTREEYSFLNQLKKRNNLIGYEKESVDYITSAVIHHFCFALSCL